MRHFVLIVMLPLSAQAQTVHLECVYRPAPGYGLPTSQLSHHIKIEYEGDDISNVISPLPICEIGPLDYEIIDEVIKWTCTDTLERGVHTWTGYLSRFISQYEVASVYLAFDSDEPRHWKGIGSCSIIERLF